VLDLAEPARRGRRLIAGSEAHECECGLAFPVCTDELVHLFVDESGVHAGGGLERLTVVWVGWRLASQTGGGG